MRAPLLLLGVQSAAARAEAGFRRNAAGAVFRVSRVFRSRRSISVSISDGEMLHAPRHVSVTVAQGAKMMAVPVIAAALLLLL